MSLFSSVSVCFLRFLFLCRLDMETTNGSQQFFALVNVMKNVGVPNCRIIAKIVFCFVANSQERCECFRNLCIQY
jgi:hypothetical protein